MLIGVLAIGLLVRMPGVFWGFNFPTGYYTHHIDEYTHLNQAAWLIAPNAMGDRAGHPGYVHWKPEYYPPGMATHVALPHLAVRAVSGELSAPLPHPAALVVTGRLISVLYGVATILVVYVLARMFFRDRPAIAHISAWIFALGGLHVTQSHFFLSDTAALFWSLLSLYLVGDFIQRRGERSSSRSLDIAALAAGVAFGMKLAPQAVPSVLIAALLFDRKLTRVFNVAVFGVAGFCLVTLNGYSLHQLYGELVRGSLGYLRDYHFSKLAGAGIYLLELPSIISFPVTILAVCGGLLLVRRLLAGSWSPRLVFLVFALPTAIVLWLVIFQYDNFPRHLLPFMPWFAIAAAYMLSSLADSVGSRPLARALIVAPVFLYLAVFVFDGERVFWREPRNTAARWLLDNVPQETRISYLGGQRSSFAGLGYTFTKYPGTPDPDLFISEGHYANWFLSGMGWRNSFPKDNTTVFPWFTDEELVSLQALFKGTTGYIECARFPEGYFMPDYVWPDDWIGNRARNYVGEVVIFLRVKPAADVQPQVCQSSVNHAGLRRR